MNPTLSVIHNRRSVRKYAETPLTEAEKDAILAAAMRAPTAGNMMLYSIIAVEDQALKDRLAVTCDDQPFIAKAPWVLLFVADYQRWMDLFEFSGAAAACLEKELSPRLPAEGDLLLACCDALIAAQTAVIAAESLGIGSCYIGDILENCEIHREMFSLPRYTLPVTLLCLGRPFAEREEVRLNKRFDREFIVHRDVYNPIPTSNLPRMMETVAPAQYAEMDPIERAKLMANNMYTRKFVAEFSIELNRSVRKWIGSWAGEQPIE